MPDKITVYEERRPIGSVVSFIGTPSYKLVRTTTNSLKENYDLK